MLNGSLANDDTARMMDHGSVISSVVVGGNQDVERENMDFGKYRSSLPVIEHGVQSFMGDQNLNDTQQTDR